MALIDQTMTLQIPETDAINQLCKELITLDPRGKGNDNRIDNRGDNFQSQRRRVVEPKISPPRDPNDEPPADIIETRFHVLRIRRRNPFVWDGSYLGVITRRNIEDEMEFMNLKYWKINLYGHTQVCIIRRTMTSCPCISDELKILFGLSKLGTHRVRYRRKLYVLIKPRINQAGGIIRETPISNIESTTNMTFISQVQDIYLFRDVLGLTKTTDWQQGYAVEFVEPAKGFLAIPIPIINSMSYLSPLLKIAGK